MLLKQEANRFTQKKEHVPHIRALSLQPGEECNQAIHQCAQGSNWKQAIALLGRLEGKAEPCFSQ
jgi:hypothetical protein